MKDSMASRMPTDSEGRRVDFQPRYKEEYFSNAFHQTRKERFRGEAPPPKKAPLFDNTHTLETF